MNARQLIAHFDRIIEAPEALDRLRRFVLELAVKGRLVPQDGNNEPAAAELLHGDRTRAETAERDRRASNQLQEMLARDERWDIPPSWEWRCLADLVLFIDYRGKTPNKVDHGIRLITAKNVREGFVNPLPQEFVSEPEYEKWMTRGLPKPGDVLFTTEAPMGNAAVVDLTERFALAQRVIDFRSYGSLNPQFLVVQLLAAPWQRLLQNASTGLTAKGIKAAKLKRLPIAVPSLAEQERIVAKIDELMRLCDELEATQANREKSRDRLAATSQRRLVDSSSDPHAFRASADFCLQRVHRLATRPEHVSEIRRTILDLAVRGRLVHQNPDAEGTGEKLLREIRNERANLIQRRKETKSRELSDRSTPFAIPATWAWSPLGEIADLVRGVSFPASDKSTEPGPGLIPCFRSGNIQAELLWDSFIYVPRTTMKSEAQLVRDNDILLSIANSYALVGKCSLVRGTEQDATFGAFLAAVRLHGVRPRFMQRLLTSSYAASAFRKGSAQTTNIANITFSMIRGLPVAIPPKAEQDRIAAKVDELFNLCDELEDRLLKGQSKRSRLLEAVLYEALHSSA